MEIEVASGSKISPETSGSSDAVTDAAKGAEIVPATMMKMVEDATAFLSELPAKLMLDGVGACFEVILLHPMPWHLTLAIL